MKLDKWQKEILATKGNICLRSGRQVGKSTVVAIKAGDYACTTSNKTIMIVAAVERQAYLLFEKVLAHIFTNYKPMIKKGKDRPTKSKICLKNGSVIYCLPTGDSGYGIRGYTINLLIADEAAFIKEDVWAAVTPALAMTGGVIWLLSTPKGNVGYYPKAFKSDNFTKFHVSTEDVLNYPNRTKKQKKDLRQHIKEAKASMSKLEYTQEYLGEFVDKLMQLFPDKLIQSCMTLQRGSATSLPSGDKFMGVDVARMGADESVLLAVNRSEDKKRLDQVDMEITTKTLTTDTVRRIKIHDKKWNFKKIYIDDGGMGVGVYDPLLEDEQTKRKVIPINNAKRSITHRNADKKRTKRLMKEDLYNNLLNLMENGNISLFDDDEIFNSLKSVQAETIEGRLKISGRYTHIAEALIRAAWCMKNKTLNIWIR